MIFSIHFDVNIQPSAVTRQQGREQFHIMKWQTKQFLLHFNGLIIKYRKITYYSEENYDDNLSTLDFVSNESRSTLNNLSSLAPMLLKHTYTKGHIPQLRKRVTKANISQSFPVKRSAPPPHSHPERGGARRWEIPHSLRSDFRDEFGCESEFLFFVVSMIYGFLISSRSCLLRKYFWWKCLFKESNEFFHVHSICSFGSRLNERVRVTVIYVDSQQDTTAADRAYRDVSLDASSVRSAKKLVSPSFSRGERAHYTTLLPSSQGTAYTDTRYFRRTSLELV